MFNNRTLISFSGVCELQCKHCYTFSKTCQSNCANDLDECDRLINSIDDKTDIVYVSHDRENFLDEKAGLALVKGIFEKKKKSVFVITRCPLSDDCIYELSSINNQMKEAGLLLVVAVSIPARESYGLLEQESIICKPEERIDVLRRLNEKGIKTILMVRPLMPNSIIPLSEVFDLISSSQNYVNAVVSSGIAVNDVILERLGLQSSSFNYMDGNNAEFLIGAEVPGIQYVDTEDEIRRVANYCEEKNIKFFRHSLDAINAI